MSLKEYSRVPKFPIHLEVFSQKEMYLNHLRMIILYNTFFQKLPCHRERLNHLKTVQIPSRTLGKNVLAEIGRVSERRLRFLGFTNVQIMPVFSTGANELSQKPHLNTIDKRVCQRTGCGRQKLRMVKVTQE